MAQTIIRMYDSQATGTKVAEELGNLGHVAVFQFNGPSGKKSAVTSESLVSDMTKAFILKNHAAIYADNLVKNGGSLVMVHAPLGTAYKATQLMEDHGPVDSGVAEPVSEPLPQWDEAAPLSSALGLPTLAITKLPAETLMGLPSLTKGTAFLSDLLGLPLLSEGLHNKSTSMGLPLLSSKPTPFSSMFGLPTLKR